MEKGRIVVVVLLVAAGVGLLLYGVFHTSIAVSSSDVAPPPSGVSSAQPGAAGLHEMDQARGSEPNQAQVTALSEPAATQEVARGGLTRDESGQIKKTYEGTEAPKACPT
ncbi:MAG: hypothetical protein A2Y77_11140 [Planctomycetes bacterium RBG_13_62_9]|nr:MAG: hypothetical protein A2Y77_11140 [Planctomycetes bacterium RBG_13_62_9]